MGNQPLITAKFVGEKKPGETQILRNILQADGQDLVKTFKGVDNLKEMLAENTKTNPDTAYLGTRKKTIKEDGTVEFGEYQWKTFKEVSGASHSIAKYLMHH